MATKTTIAKALKEIYYKQIEILCEDHPGQRINRNGYLAWGEKAEPGILTSSVRVSEKDFPEGTVVLFVPDQKQPNRLCWAWVPSNCVFIRTPIKAKFLCPLA